MVVQRDSNSWFKYDVSLPIPLSTTHEMLRAGCQRAQQFRVISRKQLNFVSYPLNDFRFDMLHKEKTKKHVDVVSSYSRDFMQPYESRCQPLHKRKTEAPDWLMNRKPCNDFHMHAGCGSKFMDDHFIDITPQRRKVNFFRQLRNQTFALGDDYK